MDIIIFTQNPENGTIISGILETEGHIAYHVTSVESLFELIELNKFNPNLVVFDIEDSELIISTNQRLYILMQSQNIQLHSILFLESQDPDQIFKLMAHNINIVPTAFSVNYLIAKINIMAQQPHMLGCASLKSDCFLHKQSLEKQEFISHQIAMIHNSISNNLSSELQSEIIKSYTSVLESLKNSIFINPILNEENDTSYFSIFSYIKIFFSTYNRLNNISINLPNDSLIIKVNKQYFVMALNKILIGFINHSDHKSTISVNYSKTQNSLSISIINCSQEQSKHLSELVSNEFLVDVIQLNGCRTFIDIYPDCFNLNLLFETQKQCCIAIPIVRLPYFMIGIANVNSSMHGSINFFNFSTKESSKINLIGD